MKILIFIGGKMLLVKLNIYRLSSWYWFLWHRFKCKKQLLWRRDMMKNELLYRTGSCSSLDFPVPWTSNLNDDKLLFAHWNKMNHISMYSYLAKECCWAIIKSLPLEWKQYLGCMTAYQTRHCIRKSNPYRACYRLLKTQTDIQENTHNSTLTHIL